MNSNEEHISDEDLASTISVDGRLSSEVSEPSDQGLVEAGIPPEIEDSSTMADLEEEPFSVKDFDEDIEGANSASLESESSPDHLEESATTPDANSALSSGADDFENEALPLAKFLNSVKLYPLYLGSWRWTGLLFIPKTSCRRK